MTFVKPKHRAHFLTAARLPSSASIAALEEGVTTRGAATKKWRAQRQCLADAVSRIAERKTPMAGVAPRAGEKDCAVVWWLSETETNYLYIYIYIQNTINMKNTNYIVYNQYVVCKI